MRIPALALLGALAAASPVAAQEPPAPAPAPAPAQDEAAARKQAKVRRFLAAARWRDSLMAGLDASFDAQVKAGRIPPEFPAKFREMADFAALEDIAVRAWGEVLDEATLDGAIAFHESEAGRKFTAASLGMLASMNEKMMPWAMEQGAKVMTALMESGQDGGDEGGKEGVLDRLRGARRAANETAAIALLRNLASCQAQIQASGKIDADRDGIGEYGTFLEMTGAVGVRAGRDFSAPGTPLHPPILSKAMAEVGPDGVVRRSGYCFRIWLPDGVSPAGFVHEVGPAGEVALSGGVGIDLSETTWCAYAWPEKAGDTGNRAFFINQSGDVLHSTNLASKWSGTKAPPGNAAFLGGGITGRCAVGTVGQDGDLWKVVN